MDFCSFRWRSKAWRRGGHSHTGSAGFSGACSGNKSLKFLALLATKNLGTVAFFCSEFWIVHAYGAYTNSALVQINKVAAIGSSLWLFGNPVSRLQALGFAVTAAGVGAKLSVADQVQRGDERMEGARRAAGRGTGTESLRAGAARTARA